MIAYWPLDSHLRPLQPGTGGPQDSLAVFQPEVGPPITRRRTTARLETWALAFSFPNAAVMGVFEDWFRDTLKDGSLPYIWRHPRTQKVSRWRFSPAEYQESNVGPGITRVAFQALMLPGEFSLAPYIARESARIPDWVADYSADRYWIDQVEVEASDLASIEGSYLVLEQRLEFTQRFFTAMYDGDVPQTAPDSEVDWLAGFENGS